MSSYSKILSSLALAALAVFAPIKSMVVTVLVLTAVDLITGVWAAKKKGLPITSRGFRRTVGKLLVYQSSLILGFLTQTYLVPDLPITKLIGATVGLTEFKSILENLEVISGQPIIKMILDKVSGANPVKSE